MTTGVESRVTGAIPSPNAATRVLVRDREARIGVEAVHALYGQAVAEMRASAGELPDTPGYRLFWSRGGEPEWADLPAHPDAHAVVGRHQRCDVWLRRDGEISLRHLLVRSTVRPDGDLALRLLDLRAPRPFHLLDEVPHRSLFATGILGWRLGRYAMVAVPTQLARSGGLPDALPSPMVERSNRLPRLDATGPRYRSCVTSLPPISVVLDLEHEQEPGLAELLVERKGRWAKVPVGARELDRGVLVGRAERCLDRGLRSVLNAEISRAHLLILRDGDAVRAYDLCSTNGTRLDGTHLRVIDLTPREVTFRLSGRNGVRLRWRRHD